MTDVAVTPKKRDVQLGTQFPAETVELALIALAMNNGNSRKATKELETDGIKICHTTINNWKLKDPDRYRAVQMRLAPRMQTRAADKWAQLSEMQAETAMKSTKRVRKNVDNIPIGRLAGATKDMTTSAAISTDKAREFRGETQEAPQHRSATEILRALKAKRVVVVEEVESVEVQP